MPVRTFDGVDDRITTALGSLGFAFGPGTIAMIMRSGSDSGALRTLFKAGSAATASRYDLEVTSTNAVGLRLGLSQRQGPTIGVTQADGWVLIAARKATGTVTPRFSKYNFGTATWTHEDAASTIGNSGTPTNGAYLGASGSTASQHAPMDLGIAAVWNVVLSDAQIEALVEDEANWSTVAPVALWPLDQAATTTAVQDTIGTADETAITGTSVTADAVPWTGGAGSFSGAIAQTLPAITQAAAGAHTAPTFSGAAAQTLPALTQSAAGSHTAPTFAGTIAQTLPSLEQAAAGSTTAPTFTGTAAQTLSSLTQSAEGSTTPPAGATVAQTLPALTQTATGSFAAPTFTAVIAQTLPPLTQSLTNRKPVATTTLGERVGLSVSLSTRSTPTLEVT